MSNVRGVRITGCTGVEALRGRVLRMSSESVVLWLNECVDASFWLFFQRYIAPPRELSCGAVTLRPYADKYIYDEGEHELIHNYAFRWVERVGSGIAHFAGVFVVVIARDEKASSYIYTHIYIFFCFREMPSMIGEAHQHRNI